MPPQSESALRAAVQRLAPAAAIAFEREFHTAWEQALQADSTVPMRTFLHRWAVWVSLHRHPARAARLRALERVVGEAVTREAARAAAVEVGELLAAATAEVTAR
ncbi:hypothetical protein RKE29_12340 [Streptomyces sp. B1866]|uniref:hypothetical protein n=1 Tax=Streptomyces sp. B1866 TaxID=3075431 RepID=UPI00288D0409|nr:hypothetical protein [Streptomyces sp. B1866]MDT3397428.1 hypothetical protein [Streptomyces sp. B1866]